MKFFAAFLMYFLLCAMTICIGSAGILLANELLSTSPMLIAAIICVVLALCFATFHRVVLDKK